MEGKKNLNYYSKYFLGIIFFVGICGHLIEPLKPIMLFLTPVTLLITGSVVLLNIFYCSNKRFIYWLIITYLMTFSAEAIGVKTKLIFGDYVYGNTLGLRILNVPLIIGFNWVLVVLGSINISKLLFVKKVFQPIASSIIALFFDCVLEPVAIQLDYWQWYAKKIPLQNYIAWFFISLVFAFVYQKLDIKLKSDLPAFYLIVQMVFFLSILAFL
jgi:bisanhydrobacterioruberin hydratase